MSRRRTLNLTDQQQHVLELMARGRTNYDIARDLGVSLDGAKYHIRQVFDKLGVDSREEAVAAWKASRGSVFERVRGWLWPVGAVAAGGVAVIAIVVAAVALSGGFGGTSSAAGGGKVAAGVWVAEIVPADPARSAEYGPIKIFRAGYESDAHVFAGQFSSLGPIGLQWSPDGMHLAATGAAAAGSNKLALWIFSRSSSSWTSVAISLPYAEADFDWSPNSKMLAMVSAAPGAKTQRASLVEVSGTTLSHVDVPAPANDQDTSQGPPPWSKDGNTVAWVINGRVAVLTPSGARIATESGGPAQVANELTGVTPQSSPPPTADAAVLAALPKQSGVQLSDEGITADGTGHVFAPFSAPGGAFDPNNVVKSYPIVVEGPTGKVVTFDLGKRKPAPTTNLHGKYDIVITK